MKRRPVDIAGLLDKIGRPPDIGLDRAAVEAAGGLRFTDTQWAMLGYSACEFLLRRSERHLHPEEKVAAKLRKLLADVGDELPLSIVTAIKARLDNPPTIGAATSPEDIANEWEPTAPARAPGRPRHNALRKLIDQVDRLLQEQRPGAGAAYWDNYKDIYTGPLFKLMRAILEQLRVDYTPTGLSQLIRGHRPKTRRRQKGF